MTGFIIRMKAAIAAFGAARCTPAYAVIYDTFDGDPSAGALVSEEYYESFGSPGQAAEMFRTAFPRKPVDPDGFSVADERLVMILGPIDDYTPPAKRRRSSHDYGFTTYVSLED